MSRRPSYSVLAPYTTLFRSWDGRAYLRHVPTVFAAVREEFGPDLPLLHDAHHRLSPNEAAILGRSLEPYDLFWLEDCTPGEDRKSTRLNSSHLVISYDVVCL